MTSPIFLSRTPRHAPSEHDVGPASPHDAAPRQNGLGAEPEVSPFDTPPDAHLSIEVEDWDVLFEAVTTTLQHIVGEQPGNPPEAAALSTSQVQAVVLDCVGALDRLHAALKQERSQRPTP